MRSSIDLRSLSQESSQVGSRPTPESNLFLYGSSTLLTWVDARYQITQTGSLPSIASRRISESRMPRCCASEARGTYISDNNTPISHRELMLHLGHHDPCLPLEVVDSSILNRYSMTTRDCWDVSGLILPMTCCQWVVLPGVHPNEFQHVLAALEP